MHVNRQAIAGTLYVISQSIVYVLLNHIIIYKMNNNNQIIIYKMKFFAKQTIIKLLLILT